MKQTAIMAVVLAALAQIAAADTALEQAQQALKEQGYYYGQVNGEKNADTTAAIRRFQIRKGLQITGELNDETRRALRTESTTDSSVVTQTATPAPRQKSDQFPAAPSTAVPAPAEPRTDASRPLIASDLFRNTPYQNAPPELQRNVVLRAQTLLRRLGYFKGELNGIAGPIFQFSLREYQSHMGIPPNGRLEMGTLAALGLLPGQRQPPMAPRRAPLPSQFAQPPVKGEWIREYPEQRREDEESGD